MIGALIVAFILIVVIPVSVMLTGSVAAALIGGFLTRDGEVRHAGSELTDLNV